MPRLLHHISARYRFVSHRAAPLSEESEAMRYCASAIVSASSLYQSADCLM